MLGTAQRFVSIVTLRPVRLTDKINTKEKKKAEESGTFGKWRQVECQCQKDLVPHCWPSIERRTLDQWLKVTNKRLSVASMGPLLHCRRKGILASPDTRIFSQRGQARLLRHSPTPRSVCVVSRGDSLHTGFGSRQ